MNETYDASTSDFTATWERISAQFSSTEPGVTQSFRARVASATHPDPHASTADVEELPLLSLADAGEAELITQRLLGEGGMGRVELAIQRSLGREVAIKSLRGAGDRPKARALLQEAVFTGFLEHPNIVPVHQLGRSAEDLPLLVMKRVDGVSWEDLIDDEDHEHWATLGEDRLTAHLAILLAVCRAVEFAHSRGILHRDIKPANVMVGAFGEVYLLDWGLAMRLDLERKSGALVGTPCQMAPEMLDGPARVDARTDVYLLGAALHMAITGTARHAGRTIAEVCHAVFQSAAVEYGPEVPAELAALCNRSTHADPAERPQSAADFRHAVERFLKHRTSVALATEASSGLSALRVLLQEDDPSRELVAGLFAECRFGFAQALRGWPANAVAIDGLQECLGLMIDRELGRGNLSLAEALFAELPQPAPELEGRLRALQEAEREREARLRHLESARDWRQGAGVRLAFFLGMVAVVGGLWFWANDGKFRYEGTLSPARLATNVGVAMALLCAVVFGLRGQLLTSEANRRLVYGALLAGGAIFVNRLANIIEAPATAALVSTELVFCAVVAALGGLTVAPWLWRQVPIWLAGAFAARLMPSYAGVCFAVSALLALAVGVWSLQRSLMLPRQS